MAIQRRYVITHRILDGTTVLGYRLRDSEGNSINQTKEITARLALDKYIDNATAQRDLKHDSIIIKGVGCELKKLPSITVSHNKKVKHVIVARIVNGKTTVGYKLQSTDGGESVVNVDKAVDMARKGQITNAKVQKFGDMYRLRGANGYTLNQINVIKV